MMTRLRTYARSVALMAVLLAQLAMAQHFSVHFMERDGGVAVAHASADGKSAPHVPDKEDICQLCLSEKLAHAAGQGAITLAIPDFAAAAFTAALRSEPSLLQPQSYYSRGPPALS
jgi:hypothetical protein